MSEYETILLYCISQCFLYMFQIGDVVTEALNQYFPEDEGTKIIAEPGRYFVASAFTLCVNIIAKRVVARDQHGESKIHQIIYYSYT